MRIAIAVVGLALLGARAARADGPFPMTLGLAGEPPEVAFVGVLVGIDEDPANSEARGRRAMTPIDAHTRTEGACPEVMRPLDAVPAVGCLAIVVTDGGDRQRATVRVGGEPAWQGDDRCITWCSARPGRVAIDVEVDRSPPWSYEPGATQLTRTATFDADAIVFSRVVSFARVELRGRRPWRTSTTITPPPPPPRGITLDEDYGPRPPPIRRAEPQRLTFVVDEAWRGVTTSRVEVSGWESTEWAVGQRYVVLGRRAVPVPSAVEIWHVGARDDGWTLDELRRRYGPR